VGIHTPEFGFEHARHNLADAVCAFGIHYPVGQDNDFRTWRARGNAAWPAFYLPSGPGRPDRPVPRGEGHARELESAIWALLGVPPPAFTAGPSDDPDLSQIGTPEVYFGALHPTPQDRAQQPRLGEAAYAFFPGEGPKPNQYQRDGTWLWEDEALVLRSVRGGVRVRFSAARNGRAPAPFYNARQWRKR
jgi:hypothetical protein